MIERQSDTSNQNRSHQIRFCKPVKTSSTTDNSNNLCIVCHSGSEENHGDENQNRHKSQNQIKNPVRIKI